MVICLTILSLQQLLDAGQYRYRFSVLRRLGVEESHIRRLVLQQLGFWFGLPVGAAILVGAGAAGWRAGCAAGRHRSYFSGAAGVLFCQYLGAV